MSDKIITRLHNFESYNELIDNDPSWTALKIIVNKLLTIILYIVYCMYIAYFVNK